MASTTSPTSGFFSSPRAQRALYWISGIVFLAGVVAIITVYATRGNSSASGSSSNQVNTPSQTSGPSVKNVKASPDALGVARRFLETAVVRKNLAESYNLVGPNLKGGFTLKQWKTGNNTVVPYPAGNAKSTALVVKSSHPNDLLLQVALVPKPGASIKKPQAFSIELNKIGGRWVVNSFIPLYQHPVKLGNG
jgi:hypothetical protein